MAATAERGARVSGRPCIALDFAHLYGMGPGHGIFRYMIDLVRGLSRLSPAASFLVIDSAERPPAELEPLFADARGPWKYVRAEPITGRAGMLRDQLPFARLLAREHVSLFHSPYKFVPFLAPCPVVVTVHDLIWELFAEHSRAAGSLNWRLHRFGVKHSVARTIADSEATAADIERLWRVPQRDISVVQLGTDFGRRFGSSTSGPSATALRGLEPGSPVIATPYNLEPQKNFSAVLRAVARLRDNQPHVRLVAFGRAGCTQPRMEAVERLIEQLGLERAVIRPGLVSDADLAWLYRRAELSVFPSLYEGFGLPALEAMAVGGCVVAQSAAASRELLADAGVIVESADAAAFVAALDALLRDPDRRATVAQRGRERASAFTIERMATATWAVYEQVLGCGQAPGSRSGGDMTRPTARATSDGL